MRKFIPTLLLIFAACGGGGNTETTSGQNEPPEPPKVEIPAPPVPTSSFSLLGEGRKGTDQFVEVRTRTPRGGVRNDVEFHRYAAVVSRPNLRATLAVR